MINNHIFHSIALAGIQFLWTIEFGFGTLYLNSLGMTPQATTLVWLAGPISGLFMQPLIGIYSDKMGVGRKPFLVAGCMVSSISLLIIAYAGLSPAPLIVAVVGFYLLDFSINCMMASCRALIVEVSGDDQNVANSVAGAMIGCGNVLGYSVGYIKLPSFLGDTQFKAVSWIAILVLALTILITCYTSTEVIPDKRDQQLDVISVFRDILKGFKDVPRPIQKIFNTQFFVWLGWFPFLFYSTAWIASTISDDTEPAEKERLGSLGMFLFALSSFLVASLTPWLKHLPLGKTWAIALAFFFLLMMFSVFSKSLTTCFIVLSLVGVPWSISVWVPFALIGSHLALERDYRRVAELESTNGEAGQSLNSGMILGIHNVYVCFPQFVSTLISFIVFTLCSEDQFGWAIRTGASFLLIGSLMAWNLDCPRKVCPP